MFELMPFTRNHGVDLYHPFRDLEEMERNFFSTSGAAAFKTDIRDTGDTYLLEADLPGMKKEDIHIDIDGDRLSISAERNAVKEEKEDGYIRCERSYGSFSRSFDISGIRAGEITAAYEDGVLKLTLPKQTKTVPASRRLEIQ